MGELKKGDRVNVNIPLFCNYNGTIIGEGYSESCWMVLKDGEKNPKGIRKPFCRPSRAGPLIEDT